MASRIGGRYHAKRQVSVSNRCIQFLTFAHDKLRSSTTNTVTTAIIALVCCTVLKWLEIVLSKHAQVLGSYAEYMEGTLTYKADTIRSHLYDLE